MGGWRDLSAGCLLVIGLCRCFVLLFGCEPPLLFWLFSFGLRCVFLLSVSVWSFGGLFLGGFLLLCFGFKSVVFLCLVRWWLCSSLCAFLVLRVFFTFVAVVVWCLVLCDSG